MRPKEAAIRVSAVPRSARGGARVLAALVLALGGGPASALQTTWAPQARTEMRLDDNIRVRHEGGHGAFGFDVGGGVEFRAESDTVKSSLTPRFNLRRFAIGDNLDTEEYFVDFSHEWLRETVTPRLDFSYSRDSTLAAEATDIGVLDEVKDRDSIRVNPSLDWTVNERWSSRASFLFNDVSYVDAERTGLVDYRYFYGSAGGTYNHDDTTQIFGTFFASDFATPETGGTTRSYGVQAGAAKAIDPTLGISAALGYIYSEIEFTTRQLALVFDPAPRLVFLATPEDATSTGAIANVAIRKEFENLVTEFTYTRQVSPSGRGAQSSSDEIRFNATRRISHRLSLMFDGRHDMRATEGDALVTGLDRDLTVLRGAVRYRLTEEWSVAGSYQFRYRTSNRDLGDTRTGDSNAVFLNVIFNGSPHRLTDGF